MSKAFSILVAATQRGGIGMKGKLPWPVLTKDMAFFQHTSKHTVESKKQNVVIMGRKTYESLPAKFRPLPGRVNVVVSRTLTPGRQLASFPLDGSHSDAASIYVASSLDAALAAVDGELASEVDKVFVIGGSEIYAEAAMNPRCHTLLMTRILQEFECDRFFKTDGLPFELKEVGELVTNEAVPYQFQVLKRTDRATTANPNQEEQQYLDLVARVIRDGVIKKDRTGTGTKSIFGAQMRFSLRDGKIPLLTTKKVFFRGVIEELLWLIRGSTDSQELAKKKVHIWDGNGSKAFLTKLGFDREEGDLGPVYGFQWRHFGAKYADNKTDYTGQGVDQLAQVIHTIKTNPNDRRIIMSAWNPVDLDKMALPPCHVMAQFYVANQELSCHMYQRSVDLGLGFSFNVASYSTLCIMLAHVCGLKPGEFVHTLADAHVYLNHIEPLKEQLTRTPRAFPTLRINRQVPDIDSFKFEDFELSGYDPMEAIKMDMAV